MTGPTHIDPFAPADSPLHPSSWRKDVKHWPAMLASDARKYEAWWNRYATELERSPDVEYATPFEEMQARDALYLEWLDEWGAPEELEEGAEFVPAPMLLQREAVSELVNDEPQEWADLFEAYGTEAERDQFWYGQLYPDLAELRGRRDVAQQEEAARQAIAEPPASARKDEVVEWSLRVAKTRGEELTFEQADAMTIKELREKYAPAPAQED